MSFAAPAHVPRDESVPQRGGMKKGQKTYKLASKGCLLYQKQVCLLLRTHMDVGGHLKEHGKTEEKWERMQARINSSDLTQGHRELLQADTNAGLTPTRNTLKRWVTEWVKEFEAFAKTAEEGNPSSTGNPSDIDDFKLGRDSYNTLMAMRNQAKEADADNQKRKAKKAEDEAIGPHVRNNALQRFAKKNPIPVRPSKKAKGKGKAKGSPITGSEEGSDDDDELPEENGVEDGVWDELAAEEDARSHGKAPRKRTSPSRSEQKATREASRSRLQEMVEVSAQEDRTQKARSEQVLQASMRAIAQGQDRLAQVLQHQTTSSQNQMQLLMQMFMQHRQPLGPPSAPAPHAPFHFDTAAPLPALAHLSAAPTPTSAAPPGSPAAPPSS